MTLYSTEVSGSEKAAQPLLGNEQNMGPIERPLEEVLLYCRNLGLSLFSVNSDFFPHNGPRPFFLLFFLLILIILRLLCTVKITQYFFTLGKNNLVLDREQS
jgi:hypothetical protein